MVACRGNFQAQQVTLWGPRGKLFSWKSPSSQELCQTPYVCLLPAVKKSRSIHEQLPFPCFPSYSSGNLATALSLQRWQLRLRDCRCGDEVTADSAGGPIGFYLWFINQTASGDKVEWVTSEQWQTVGSIRWKQWENLGDTRLFQVIYIFVTSESWGASYDMKAGRLKFSSRRNRTVWKSTCFLSMIDCILVWLGLLVPSVEAQFKMVTSHKL